MSVDIPLEWRRFVAKHIENLADKFENVGSDKERLALCSDILQSDASFSNIIESIKTEIERHSDEYYAHVEQLIEHANSVENDFKPVMPMLAKGPHPKISNGSALIQLNCSKTQGRYLQAKEEIKAGDVLILEKPYAAVLVQDNKATHCSHCFMMLGGNVFACHGCQVRYCSRTCWQDAWMEYHKNECHLKPLLEMLEISSHLALRLLLVTGPEKLLEFLQEGNEQDRTCKDVSSVDKLPGCTSSGVYPGDYASVYSLVTNTESQPPQALVSYAMDAALITHIAYDYIHGQLNPELRNEAVECDEATRETGVSGISRDVMGCLLLHHMEQMPCNIHAITAVVTTSEQSGVASKEQRRIAAGIYPTASLLNHACDPDVIVSFLDRSLVARATHNIKPGEEIAHCYGPSASRMTREVRQSLLQKQYFFTCGCSACKSDENFEEQYIHGAVFSCPKCSNSVVVCRENGASIGKCQDSKCGNVQDFSSEISVFKDAQKLFNRAMQHLEEGKYEESVSVLKECMKQRQMVLQKYDKDVAETHDALARCYASLGDFRQASFHCEQSTESVRRRFGGGSIEYAHELHKFAQLLFNGRLVTKASTVIDNAIRLLSIHYGEKYSDVGELQEMKTTLKNFLKGRT